MSERRGHPSAGGRRGRLPAAVPRALWASSAVAGLIGTGSIGAGLIGAGPAGAGTPDASGALADVQAAAQGTLGTTAAVTLRLAEASALGPGASVARAEGAFDFGTDRGELTLAPAAGVREPIVFTATEVFLQPPSLSASILPPSRPWLVANFTSPETLALNFPQFILQVESIDPAFTLSEIAWGATAARPVGSATVGGRPARRYRVTVDLAQAARRAGGPAQVPFAYAIHSETSYATGGTVGGTTQMGVTVWVSAGRVVQVVGSPPGAGVGTTTLDLAPPQHPVAVALPPPSRTTDVGELSPAAERELNGGGDSDGA